MKAMCTRLPLLLWALSTGCPELPHLLLWGVQAGSLEVVEFMTEKGWQGSSFTCATAARGGHLEILQHLRAK